MAKPCRVCGGNKISTKDCEQISGWSTRLYCKGCGHCVDTVICVSLTSSRKLAHMFWELDN